MAKEDGYDFEEAKAAHERGEGSQPKIEFVYSQDKQIQRETVLIEAKRQLDEGSITQADYDFIIAALN